MLRSSYLYITRAYGNESAIRGGPEKYDPIIHAIKNIYQINFKNHDLRYYIYQATHNLVTGLGMGVLQNYID